MRHVRKFLCKVAFKISGRIIALAYISDWNFKALASMFSTPFHSQNESIWLEPEYEVEQKTTTTKVVHKRTSSSISQQSETKSNYSSHSNKSSSNQLKTPAQIKPGAACLRSMPCSPSGDRKIFKLTNHSPQNSSSSKCSVSSGVGVQHKASSFPSKQNNGNSRCLSPTESENSISIYSDSHHSGENNLDISSYSSGPKSAGVTEYKDHLYVLRPYRKNTGPQILTPTPGQLSSKSHSPIGMNTVLTTKIPTSSNLTKISSPLTKPILRPIPTRNRNRPANNEQNIQVTANGCIATNPKPSVSKIRPVSTTQPLANPLVTAPAEENSNATSIGSNSSRVTTIARGQTPPKTTTSNSSNSSKSNNSLEDRMAKLNLAKLKIPKPKIGRK